MNRITKDRQQTMRRILSTPSGFIGATVLAVIVLAATVGTLLVGDPIVQDYQAVLQPPSSQHVLGTDDLGRDVLARVVYGSRASLIIGATSTLLAAAAGVVIGLVAGHFGTWVDELFMRIMDALHAFPAIMLALAIAAALGASGAPVTVAIAVVYVPVFARLVRGQVLQVRELDYVLASKLLGAGTKRLLARHVFPNVSPPVIVQVSLVFSFAILAEAGLSFLGMGIRPPAPSWGQMLRSGYDYLDLAPWLAIAPGVAIFVCVLALNLLGDSLRQALDPRLRAAR